MRTSRLSVALFLVAWALAKPPCIWGQDRAKIDSRVGLLVEQLDHPDYQTRHAACAQLIVEGTSQNDSIAQAVKKALRKGLKHPSVEVRAASSEALLAIGQMQRDAQIQRLLNPRSEPSKIHLAGWQRFSELAGHDMAARRMFAKISHRYPRQLRCLDSAGPYASLQRIAEQLDPYRLPSYDVKAWLLLLWLDIDYRSEGLAPKLTSRIGTALSNSVMGPIVTRRKEDDVVRRVIGKWLVHQEQGCAVGQRIVIAMRYECRPVASELCDAVFADPAASPSTQVTALLSSLALGGTEIESHARARLEDDRTAHVWQLLASRKTKIRTQVRDVALAVLLQHYGIDPRTAGFGELQADPMFVFRDHSLGFPDETSRRRTFQAAMKRLPPP